MKHENQIILIRLLSGIGLFFVYVVTAPSLPVMAIPFFLAYLILLQLAAYFTRQGPVRILLLLLTLAVGLRLGQWHPRLYSLLIGLWLYEILVSDPVQYLFLYLVLFVAGTGYLHWNASLVFDYTDLLFLLFIMVILVVLRGSNAEKKALDRHLLELTKSYRNLEMEQHRTRLHMDQLRELYTLEERNRISRDMHDSVGHTLSAIRIQLEAIATVAPADGDKASDMARKLAVFAEEGLQRLRRILHDIKPPRYSEQALMMRLMQIADTFSSMSQIQVHVTASQFMYQTSYSQDQMILHALQEFLSNASRHGKASQVNVHLQYSQTGLILTMKDNGTGSAGFRKNLGIKGVEERARAEGGRVEITTAPGAGFTTHITLPRTIAR